MAKLTNTEKYAIQQLVGEGKNLREIATTLEKTEKAIERYVAETALSIIKTEQVKAASVETVSELPQPAAHEPKQVKSIAPAPHQIRRKDNAGNESIIGAVKSQAGSERVDAIRKLTKKTVQYSPDIQPLRNNG